MQRVILRYLHQVTEQLTVYGKKQHIYQIFTR